MLYKAIFKDVSKDVDLGFRLPVPNSEQQHSHSRFLAKNKENPFHSPRLRRLFARSCYSVFALTANLHLVPSYFQTRMAIDQIRPDHSTTTTGIWGGIFARYGVFSNVSFINLFPFFLLPVLLCCSHTHIHYTLCCFASLLSSLCCLKTLVKPTWMLLQKTFAFCLVCFFSLLFLFLPPILLHTSATQERIMCSPALIPFSHWYR